MVANSKERQPARLSLLELLSGFYFVAEAVDCAAGGTTR